MRSVSQGTSIPSSVPLDCDVALGLKMPTQPTHDQSHSGGGSGGASYFRYNTGDNSVVLPRSNIEFDDAYLRAFGGEGGGGCGMAEADKVVFTASQWQELEKQTLIHKYIMASVPVPPQLLFSPSLPPVVSQSNMVPGGLDLLRFSSSGSDPEPWRCRRTDGKKWRCSRDVAPEQKYCDRHAHKTRPRSRKPVDLSSQTAHSSYRNSTATATTATNNNNNNAIPVRQQLHQLIQASSSSSPGLEFKNNKHNMESNIGIGSILGSQMASPQISSKGLTLPAAASSSNKLSTSSLSLSTPGGNGIIDEDDDLENVYNLNKYYDPWVMNSSSHPGGPLGEALCLGNASVTGGGSNLASPHDSSNNNSNRWREDDDSHGFNFIG